MVRPSSHNPVGGLKLTEENDLESVGDFDGPGSESGESSVSTGDYAGT